LAELGNKACSKHQNGAPIPPPRQEEAGHAAARQLLHLRFPVVVFTLVPLIWFKLKDWI
jgi:hypothetical protein